MKKFLMLSILLLSGCCTEENNIIVIHRHPTVTDSMHQHPDLQLRGSLYVDDIIK